MKVYPMAIYKISYSKKYKRANVHNFGCNFNCPWCSYKLQGKRCFPKFLSINEIKHVLKGLDIERVHFVGGELTTYPHLFRLCDFTRHELDVYTKIGHSNGYNLPPDSVDAISVSIKSLSRDFYRKYSGKSNKPVLENFEISYQNGVYVDASSVLIPGLVETREIEKISKFIANVDPQINYHITGYIPVPGNTWRSPTRDEMENAKNVAEKHLKNVSISWFPSAADYIKMTAENPKYQSIPI